MPISLLINMILLLNTAGFSQSKKNKFTSTLYLEAKVHYGFLIPHHAEMWALTNGYFPLWEFSLTRQTYGQQASQYYRKYPQVSLTYIYSDFGMSQPLGVMHAVMQKIRLPMFSGEKFRLNFGMGLGAAYMSKKFDRLTNYHNLAIGSHINAAIKFEILLRWKLNPRMYFTSGLSMLHVSNGTIKSPNYGLNMPGVFAGISWKITKKEIKFQVPETYLQNKGKINVSLMGSMASRQIIDVTDEHFKIVACNLIVSRFYNNINKFLLGVDAIYDESTKFRLEQNEIPRVEWPDMMKIGVSIGHEWSYSQISILANFGCYIYNKNQHNAILYNKIGVNYYFLKFAFVGLTLQAHWAKAEFLSLGLGLKL